jgi:hypothetical protein
MLQEGHRIRSKRSLTRLVYIMTFGLVLAILALIFAPISISTLNIAINATGLTETGHYQIRINGALVEQGDILPRTIIITTVPYRFPWAFTGQQQITIEATVYGANSDQSDSRSLTVNDGGTYSVTLNL